MSKPDKRPGSGGLEFAALGVILALGAALRLWAIRWGLPDETHLFSYHPDEFHSLRGALSLASGDPNPHFFNYGSLYLYLVAVACLWHDAVLGGANLPLALLRGTEVHREMAAWVLDARLVVVVCGVLTVYAAWLMGRQIGGPRSGLWAGGLMAVMPLHVLNSHYATVDVPQALFIALCLYFSTRLVDGVTTRDCILAGIACGLAASVKYNGAVVLVAPAVALFVAHRPTGNDAPGIAKALGLMIAAAAVAFAVTSPYVLLAWPEAWEHIRYEMEHMRVGESPWKEIHPNGWLFHLHVAVLLATLALMACRGWDRARLLPSSVFALVWFVMIGAAQVRYGRYALPLEVALPILAAGLAACVYSRATAPPWRWLTGRGLALAAAFCLALSINRCVVLSAPDPRDQMLELIQARVPEDATLALIWEPWFNVAPVDYCNGGAALRANPLFARFKRPVRELLVAGLDADKLAREKPFAVLTSDFDLPPGAERISPPHQAMLSELGKRQLTSAEPAGRPVLAEVMPRAKSDMHYAGPLQRLWLLKPEASSGP